MRFNKKQQAGFQERLAVLAKYLPTAHQWIEQALLAYPRKQVLRDDMVDALVCALSAQRATEISTLPQKPEKDEHGLPMQIAYWLP